MEGHKYMQLMAKDIKSMTRYYSVADERHNGVKLPVLLKIFNKQEFVSMFELS